jgi:hypothetical protein
VPLKDAPSRVQVSVAGGLGAPELQVLVDNPLSHDGAGTDTEAEAVPAAWAATLRLASAAKEAKAMSWRMITAFPPPATSAVTNLHQNMTSWLRWRQWPQAYNVAGVLATLFVAHRSQSMT